MLLLLSIVSLIVPITRIARLTLIKLSVLFKKLNPPDWTGFEPVILESTAVFYGTRVNSEFTLIVGFLKTAYHLFSK